MAISVNSFGKTNLFEEKDYSSKAMRLNCQNYNELTQS